MQTTPDLFDELLTALRSVPGAGIVSASHEVPISRAGQFDAQVEYQIGDKRYALLVEIKSSIYPRDIAQLIWLFRKHRTAPDSVQVPFLLAQAISPAAKELLREERIGYFDSGGSMYLSASGTHIHIDKPTPKAMEKADRSLYSGRTTQVLHTLLIHHDAWFGVKDLASQAMVSMSTVSKALSTLEQFDWLDTRGKGPSKERRLAEPGALLDAWAKQKASAFKPHLSRFYVPATDTTALMEKIAGICEESRLDYAVTHEAAAQKYSPFLTRVSQVRCRLLAGTAAQTVALALDARPVNEGANLAVLEVKSEGDFLHRRKIDSVYLASPIQVYLDLLTGEGRAKEMAAHMRTETIGF